METIIFACISLVFLIPIFYFLPIGIDFKGKIILMGAAMIAAMAGLVANFTYNPWLGALLSLLLLVIFTYLFEKKTELFALIGKEQGKEDYSYNYAAESTVNDKGIEQASNYSEQGDQHFEQLLHESEEEIVEFDSEPDLDHIILEKEIKNAPEAQSEPTPVLTSEEFDFFQNQRDLENSNVEYEDKPSASESELVEEWDEDLFLEVMEPLDDKEVLSEEGSVLTNPTVSLLPEEIEEWDEDLFLEVVEPDETEAEVVDEWDEDLFLEVLEPETIKEELVAEEELPVNKDENLISDAGKESEEVISLAELLESENLIEEIDPLEENVYVEMFTDSEAAASLEEQPEWVGQNVVEEIDSEEILKFIEEPEAAEGLAEIDKHLEIMEQEVEALAEIAEEAPVNLSFIEESDVPEGSEEVDEQLESNKQDVEVIAESALEAPVMTDIDTSTEQQESVKEDAQSEMPVHKTKLQQELFQTLIEELKLAKKQKSDHDYELLVSSYLDDSLPHQDYYIFANMLIQQYVQTKNQEKLSQLLERLEDKFQAYPVVLAEINYLKNRFCKGSY